jgi:hypothetical protein
MGTVTKYLDSGALDPSINPEITPTTGVSLLTPEVEIPTNIITTQPSAGSIIADTPQNLCDQKWATYSASMTFPTQEAYMVAYNAFLAKCLNTGVTPTLGTSQVTIAPIDDTIKPIRTSTTTTPTTPTTPTTTNTVGGSMVNTGVGLGGLIGGLIGGGAGGAGGAGGGDAVQQDLTKKKKPFPYWILIVGAVGAYLIFRKK